MSHPTRGHDVDDDERGEGRLGPDASAEATERRLAAAYLRAARLTDDRAERDSLRRRAAELLAPRKRPRLVKPAGR